MKKALVNVVFLLALGAFAAAQTTPTTTPSNTNNTGTQNPTQVTPVPNPNAPPPPDANTNTSTTNQNQTGTATSTGSANPDATTKSGDADQTTTTTPATTPATTTTQDQTTTTTTTTTAAPQSARATYGRTGNGKDSVVGCLESANNGQFTIRTAKNDVAVVPSSNFRGTFAEHVGHKVRVRGSYAATETAMNTNADAKLPQSDQPTSANGTVQNDNPVKADTRADTRASDTSADSNTSAKASVSSREFRADSIDMLAKTCGNNNYNKKK